MHNAVINERTSSQKQSSAVGQVAVRTSVSRGKTENLTNSVLLALLTTAFVMVSEALALFHILLVGECPLFISSSLLTN